MNTVCERPNRLKRSLLPIREGEYVLSKVTCKNREIPILY